jgi:hypothetical protein
MVQFGVEGAGASVDHHDTPLDLVRVLQWTVGYDRYSECEPSSDRRVHILLKLGPSKRNFNCTAHEHIAFKYVRAAAAPARGRMEPLLPIAHWNIRFWVRF